jgi:predicted O-methyltransferase YrrM
MNAVIEAILQRGMVEDQDGQVYPLQYSVDAAEGEFLVQLIQSDPTILKTLEIGCAYGMSALYICEGLSGRAGAYHTIVDPNQTTRWRSVGIHNLQRAGFDFFELIEKPSEFALADLAQQAAHTFDLIFIDGWHTFDHTLLDLFYANRLLKVGGYIVVDDCHLPAIAKAISYFSTYPAYEVENRQLSHISFKRRLAGLVQRLVPPTLASFILPRNIYDRHYLRTRYPSIVSLHKVQEDQRNWDWFVPF